MANWITHLMIADQILIKYPQLHRRGYCVGSIAPDCNVENETWTQFTPSREETHWIQGKRKSAADCDRFRDEYLLPRLSHAACEEETAFLLGYYSHLIADAECQRFVRDKDRVHAAWQRIENVPGLAVQMASLPPTWDSVKMLIPKSELRHDIACIETDYLNAHPTSGYLTEILPLTAFPNYTDLLPDGSIVRKIGVMGQIPTPEKKDARFLAISREEYTGYIRRSIDLIAHALEKLCPLA